VSTLVVAAPPVESATSADLFSRAFDEIRVGDRFETHGRTVTEADVVGFSAWTGDRHPVHTDRHWSEQYGLYGQRIAHGLLIVSYTVGLLPLDYDRVVAMRRMRDIVFKRPAFLGDTLRGRGRVEKLRVRGEFGCVITQLETLNQADEVVARGTFEMLWRRGTPSVRDED
jgi:3-hydroxybutyryl-CoA dehydratase